MAHNQVPELSVILATPDNYDTIRTTIGYLRRQTARSRMELVIVAPSLEDLRIDGKALSDFLCYRVAEVGEISSISSANAEGIRHATAPVVVLAEDHAFPDPDWADALIAAHRGKWAAVGPVIRNANPNCVVSWADLLIAYAPWLVPSLGGVCDHLPGHNSSYKREVLLSYGSDLEAMMNAESVLHWDLRAKGHSLYLEAGARLSHMNFGRLTSWLPAQFYSGQVFAASRARSWSIARRMAYLAGAPAIPLVRLWRIVRQTRLSGSWKLIPSGVIPMLGIGLVASAIGEMVGYAAGPKEHAKRKLAEFEFHRVRHQPEWHRQPVLRESNGI